MAGIVSKFQFEEVFTLLKLYPTTSEINLVFKNYNKDKNMIFSFREFVEMISPRDENYKNMLMNRKSQNCKTTYARAASFLPHTQEDFRNLLNLIVQTEVRINEVKHSLNNRRNFDIQKAFEACGGGAAEGTKIGKIHMLKFLLSQGYNATDRQLGWLIERMDRFGNGTIDA